MRTVGWYTGNDIRESLIGVRAAAERMRHLPEQRITVSHMHGLAFGCVSNTSGGGVNVFAHEDDYMGVVAGEIIGVRTPEEFQRRVVGSLRAIRRGHETGVPFSLDGPFAIALFDIRDGCIHLLSDRYGGAPIYYHSMSSAFGWASEAKCFAALAGSLAPDLSSLQEFLEKGYITPPATSISGVRQLAGRRLLTYRVESGDMEEVVLDDASPSVETGGERDQSGEFMRRLDAALERRLEPYRGEVVAVTLSGGLDSRLLAAASSRLGHRVHALTYGRPDSKEIRIASRVAGALRIPHKIVPVESDGWLHDRELSIWASDGMVDFLHTHIMHLGQELKRYPVVLDGLFGDVVLGRGAIIVDRAQGEAANRYLRMNRFTYFGPRLESIYCNVVAPLIDAELVRFMDSLPAAEVADGRLYRNACGERFPEVFRTIPWHKTGRVPSPYSDDGTAVQRDKLRKRVLQGLAWMRVPIGSSYFTMNYAYWIRSAAYTRLVRNLVYGPDGIARSVLRIPSWQELSSIWPSARNYAGITRVLTVETWLRQYASGRPLRWSEMLPESVGSNL